MDEGKGSGAVIVVLTMSPLENIGTVIVLISVTGVTQRRRCWHLSAQC